MRVLIWGEFSGIVRDAFLARDHDAMSADFLPSEKPGPHFQGNGFDILGDRWDLLIAHPPCTYLCNSGAKHLYKGMKKINGPDPARWENMRKAAFVFKRLLEAPIEKICIENPIMLGCAKTIIGMDWTQNVQPHWFGHEEIKAICLWLKNLPPLVKTDDVGPPPTNPEWRKDWAVVHRAPPGPDRWKDRSRTYTGLATAMAEQWG